MMIPTIHKNGSSKDDLAWLCSDALEAVRHARSELVRMSPNGRDYYPQGDRALSKAFEEHAVRIGHLDKVIGELEIMLEAIADGGHKPG